MNLKFFNLEEFDSPDEHGSGELMSVRFLRMLDKARAWIEVNNNSKKPRVVFRISSGYRTQSHNQEVGGVANSSHLKGLAADIRYSNDYEKNIILIALASVGFQRFGIHKNFIHVDCDESKEPSVWYYDELLLSEYERELIIDSEEDNVSSTISNRLKMFLEEKSSYIDKPEDL